MSAWQNTEIHSRMQLLAGTTHAQGKGPEGDDPWSELPGLELDQVGAILGRDLLVRDARLEEGRLSAVDSKDLQQAQLRRFQRGRCTCGALQLAKHALDMGAHGAWADGQFLRYRLVARPKAIQRSTSRSRSVSTRVNGAAGDMVLIGRGLFKRARTTSAS